MKCLDGTNFIVLKTIIFTKTVFFWSFFELLQCKVLFPKLWFYMYLAFKTKVS